MTENQAMRDMNERLQIEKVYGYMWLTSCVLCQGTAAPAA
jgi:hypothetical protein